MELKISICFVVILLFDEHRDQNEHRIFDKYTFYSIIWVYHSRALDDAGDVAWKFFFFLNSKIYFFFTNKKIVIILRINNLRGEMTNNVKIKKTIRKNRQIVSFLGPDHHIKCSRTILTVIA